MLINKDSYLVSNIEVLLVFFKEFLVMFFKIDRYSFWISGLAENNINQVNIGHTLGNYFEFITRVSTVSFDVFFYFDVTSKLRFSASILMSHQNLCCTCQL